MAINGTLFAMTKTKNEIDSVEIFKSMMLEVNASGAVVMDGRNIAAGSIYANQLSAGSITATKIKAGEITTDHITTSGISADKIKTGTLTATNGASWINMNDGKFSFGGGKITYNGSVLAVNVDSLQITNKSVATETYVSSSVAPAISAASAAQTTANTATTNAATAQTAANAAQTSANTATTNAATAKSAADAAQTTANTANSTANTAKTNAATAQTAANTASGSASTANSLLADLASDSKLTASEKKASKKEWDVIVSEKTKIETEASDYEITTELSAFTTQYNALSSYITSLLADLSTTSTIVGTTFRTNFKNYYDAKQDLLNAITTKAKSLADAAAANASTAQTAANTANTAAGAAQSTANTANGTANTAKTNAATAQTAANTANSAAGTAQTTANTANTAAGAAQSTANTANSTANTAKTNAGTAQTAANTAQATADVVKGVVTNFDSVIINANPIFLDWTSTYPTGYNSSAGGPFAKVTSGNGMGNALRYTVTAGAEAYLNPATITTSPFFTYVSIEVTFKLDSGTINGSGILFRYNATSNVDHYIKLRELMPSPVLGKWYTVNKIIKQASAPSGFIGYQIYVMGAWTSFETVTAKVIQFDSVKTRPANEQEINAYENNIKIEDWTYTGTTEISGGKIRADTVTATQIAASTITATQIAANTITAAKIAASTITATQIAAATITGAKIVTDTITATQIAAGTITATQIATNAIIADKILANAITTAKIATNAVTANEIAAATITATEIKGGTITATQIAANAITVDKILANAVTTAKIATNAVTANEIAAGTITATEIKSRTLTADRIAAGAITANEIKANSITIGSMDSRTFSQGQITINPIFSEWPSTYPVGYTVWSGSAGYSKETTLTKNGGYGVRFSVTAAATQTGLQLATSGTIDNQVLPKYLVVEVDFMLVSGTIAGAGLLIDWNGVTGGNRVDFSLVKEVPSPVLNKWYTVRRVVKAPSTAGTFTSIAGFLMGNYSPLGGAVKNIIFDRVALREPTLEEINTFEGNVSNAVTTINKEGIVVKDGSFFLEDNNTDTKYSIVEVENMIQDHSFELVYDAGDNQSYGLINMTASMMNYSSWSIIGTPVLQSGVGAWLLNTKSSPLALFGRHSVNLTNTAYIRTQVQLSVVGEHTISAYFKAAFGATGGGTPKIVVNVFDSRGNLYNVASKTFAAVDYVNSDTHKRHSVTFHTGSIDPGGALTFAEIFISSGNTQKVNVDGVQMVVGSYATRYESENSVWEMAMGRISPSKIKASTIELNSNGYEANGFGFNANNSDIYGVNSLQFNDPGVNEGVSWVGGNGWGIFESPDALTNGAGNLQFASVAGRQLTITTEGDLKFKMPGSVNFTRYGNMVADTGAGNWSITDQWGKAMIQIYFKDSPAEPFYMNNDGTNYVGSKAIYNRTYSGAANAYVTGTGVLGRSTSASKYKLNINEVDVDGYAEHILDLKVKSWFDKAASESNARYLELKQTNPEEAEGIENIPIDINYGLIAEDVIAVGLKQFASYQYMEDGSKEVEGIQYERLWTLLIPIVKRHEETLRKVSSTLWAGNSNLEGNSSISPKLNIQETLNGWGLIWEAAETDENGDIISHTEYITKQSIKKDRFSKLAFQVFNGSTFETAVLRVSSGSIKGSSLNAENKMILKKVFAW